MKIIDIIKVNNKNGFDIADDTWDCGNYFECNTSLAECKDDYYRVQYVIGTQLEVIKLQLDWFTICNISEFIIKNIDMFNEFLNKVYKEEYQPQNMEEPIDPDDEYWCDFYIDGMFFDILNGNFAEPDYTILYNLMKKYNLVEEE